ncbi:lactate racemase domain-containing protein [Roseimaritima sediminicola]|uniref:lactate racemase domain-containing protein n=1 Tax=Roseimaritima sediminicola TaxID=2662066 RepID=UPI00129828C1|nr:lactate racemase domain-containing protein [Roseimaritima sediminicola]
MTTYFAEGSATTDLSRDDIRSALEQTFQSLGSLDKVLILPPDYTRLPSRAGEITSLTYEMLGKRVTDIMPALGTHHPMSDAQIADMFRGVPAELIREHRWRDDVVTLGEVPSPFVAEATEGIYDKPWPAQVNRLLSDGGHDLIFSVGQVVPHEVIGMANYNKNVFVGTGGARGINESHFLSAVYGMERTMGRADTPLRRILNYAQDHFCQDMPLLYALTVIEEDHQAQRLITRGLYIGDDHETFYEAAKLSYEVNFVHLDRAPKHVVAYLDPSEFTTTWVGNKSIYRTRMAIADGGRLTVLGPAVKEFGEDREIDHLIRKYGYRTTPEILRAFENNADLAANPSAAAHLIHGSSEGRFEIVYAAGQLSREEVEGVGYTYAELGPLLERYPIDQLSDGWNPDRGEGEFYFVRNPALGLWEAPRG